VRQKILTEKCHYINSSTFFQAFFLKKLKNLQKELKFANLRTLSYNSRKIRLFESSGGFKQSKIRKK